MSQTWFNGAVNRVMPILNKIRTHPFIKDLGDGSLDAKRFHFYMHQDSYYLNTYGKVLANISTRLSHPEHALQFMNFSSGTIEVEKALHKNFIQKLDRYDPPKKSPTCGLYTGFLSEINQFHPVEEALAAVLPCFWIYKEIGDYLLQMSNRENNPYQNWIDTYGGEDFANSVEKAIDITEVYAQKSSDRTKALMMTAFYTTAQLEWMFWDSAYKLEQWPV